MKTNENKGVWHYGYTIVLCCCLMMGVNVGLTFSCAGVFFKPVSQSLGVPVGEFGWYVAVMYLTSALMLTMAGSLIERFSARWLLAGSSALMGLAFLGMSLAGQLWQFYVAGGVLGLTLAFLMYLSFPTLVNRWFRRRVGVMIGLCAAASGLGGVIFNPVAGALIDTFGWRGAYGCFAALILIIITPLLALLLRDHPADKGLRPYGADDNEVSVAAGDGVDLPTALRMPVFYAVMLFSLIMMGVSTLNLFVASYVSSLEYTLEQGALVAATVMGGAAVGKVALGWINDRNCLLGVAVTTLFGMGGLVLMLLFPGELWVLFAGAFLFGWEYSGVTVQTAMLTKTVFGTRHYSRIYSIVSIALAVGGALAVFGGGSLLDSAGYTTVFWGGAGAMILAFILGSLPLLVSRKRSRVAEAC